MWSCLTPMLCASCSSPMALRRSVGEKFGPDEVSEFLNAACDPETGQIHYDDYVALLADL